VHGGEPLLLGDFLCVNTRADSFQDGERIFGYDARNRQWLPSTICMLLVVTPSLMSEFHILTQYHKAIYAVTLSLLCIGFVWGSLEPYRYTRQVLHKKLWKKAMESHAINAGDSPVVGLSPGDKLRNFDGDTAWDVGLLVVQPGRLLYLGDFSVFELEPGQVQTVERKCGLFGSHDRVMVTWRETPDADEHKLSLELWSANWFWDARRRTAALRTQMKEWLAGRSQERTIDRQFGLPAVEADIAGFPAAYGLSSAVVPAMLVSITAMFACALLMSQTRGGAAGSKDDVAISLVCLASIVPFTLLFRRYLNSL
jgi:hypothetical protein